MFRWNTVPGPARESIHSGKTDVGDIGRHYWLTPTSAVMGFGWVNPHPWGPLLDPAGSTDLAAANASKVVSRKPPERGKAPDSRKFAICISGAKPAGSFDGRYDDYRARIQKCATVWLPRTVFRIKSRSSPVEGVVMDLRRRGLLGYRRRVWLYLTSTPRC